MPSNKTDANNFTTRRIARNFFRSYLRHYFAFLAKLKSTKYILLLSYFASFVILIISFGIKFKLSSIEQDKEYYRMLDQAKQIHFQIIQNELIKTLTLLDIVHKNSRNLSFLRKNLLFNFIRISDVIEFPSFKDTFKLKTTPNLVDISAGFYTIQIDTNLLKHSLSKNISTDMNFTIYINDQVVVNKGEQGTVFTQNKIDSPFLSVITITLSIKEDCLRQNKIRSIKTQLLEFILIIVPIIIINIIFRRFYLNAIIKKFKAVEVAHLNLLEEQSLLMRHLKTKSYCNELLVAKIKKTIKDRALEETGTVDDILYFPLLIEEDQCGFISSATFFEDLTSFFQYSINKKKIDFQYSGTDNAFAVHLSKESFYQLTFSLIHNILHLLNNKSFLVIKFEITDNKLVKIIIKYNGFQLNNEQIKNYTKEQGKGEIFLLNMNHTLKGLETLCINWEIKNENDGNIFQLNFKNNSQRNKLTNEENKIINLRDYQNK